MSDFIKVKEGISGSVAHEVGAAAPVDAYISEQIARIDTVNPHLMKEVCSFALITSDKLQATDPRFKEKLRAHMVSAGIIVYRMLESQVEADELDDLLGE